MPLLDAATIEQDMDAVSVGEDSGGKLSDGVVGRQIGGVDGCLATEFLDRFFCLLIRRVALGIVSKLSEGLEVPIYLDKEDVCSCFGEGNRHRLTNSSCASCYEGGLPLERVELLYSGHRLCETPVVIGMTQL